MLLDAIYRAIVEPTTKSGPYIERVVFVQDHTMHGAAKKITALIAAIDGVPESQVSFYNLEGFFGLVGNGVSEDKRLRLFETGWRGAQVEGWVEYPIFAVPDPAPLFRLWSSIPKRAEV